ncbi:MAG: hypothetical protein M4D80_08895 [Myxococcota bacterium]|nr:hypothetical protein [Myxococcota bacterium]
MLFLLACSSSKPADPNRRLTKAECTEGVDHAIALFEREPMPDVAKSMRDGRAGFIAQCEATALAHDHACLMKSKTAHDLGLCPMPGTPVGGAR